jgi:hypothetical protein
MWVGSLATPPLQRTDRFDAESGLLGQLFLRQAGGLPQLPQALAERQQLLSDHAGTLRIPQGFSTGES